MAKVLTFALTPACQLMLQDSQKGFVNGRSGSDHIHSLTDKFYSSLHNRQRAHVLQMDTKKAFDSIDHSYINILLEVVGFAEWTRDFVSALYRFAAVTPVLAAHTGVLIPICRGVKQGCPLSPLLFAIAYDPLLFYLSLLSTHDPSLSLFAYADDLAIFSLQLITIISAISVIEVFRNFSGLGVNVDKSRLLSVYDPTSSERRRIANSEWPAIELVTQIKYLGIIIGRSRGRKKVGTVEIFGAPMAKLKKRVALYSAVFQRLSLHLRVIGVNVFLISLFSYHIQFYIPDPVVCEGVYKLIRKLVVPFRGTAFVMQHLFYGPRYGEYGLKTPLKDIYAMAIATLANKFDLPSLHGISDLSIPGFDHGSRVTWNSFRVQDHINYAAWDMALLLKDGGGWSNLVSSPPTVSLRERSYTRRS